jgi:hypothetical protein
MLFVGKFWSDKTNDMLKHLMMTDSLRPNGSPFIQR